MNYLQHKAYSDQLNPVSRANYYMSNYMNQKRNSYVNFNPKTQSSYQMANLSEESESYQQNQPLPAQFIQKKQKQYNNKQNFFKVDQAHSQSLYEQSKASIRSSPNKADNQVITNSTPYKSKAQNVKTEHSIDSLCEQTFSNVGGSGQQLNSKQYIQNIPSNNIQIHDKRVSFESLERSRQQDTYQRDRTLTNQSITDEEDKIIIEKIRQLINYKQKSSQFSEKLINFLELFDDSAQTLQNDMSPNNPQSQVQTQSQDESVHIYEQTIRRQSVNNTNHQYSQNYIAEKQPKSEKIKVGVALLYIMATIDDQIVLTSDKSQLEDHSWENVQRVLSSQGRVLFNLKKIKDYTEKGHMSRQYLKLAKKYVQGLEFNPMININSQICHQLLKFLKSCIDFISFVSKTYSHENKGGYRSQSKKREQSQNFGASSGVNELSVMKQQQEATQTLKSLHSQLISPSNEMNSIQYPNSQMVSPAKNKLADLQEKEKFY
ncbi:UNKNOWN [Stylonychia lemnae]|uniref:Uncharacterized protein n=1 Tax=Stylonychia lemnae TaxID=5949 RepID=A0A078AB58_STYLE|nr:UNKNOWN [Stylonychia lemnae]|eukprot:CDW79525.1 UNKNOWN [Stylonychia lemnae]